MASGTKPFEGESAASLIGAILKDTPAALKSRQPLTPASLEQVVERCLAKEPDQRWQSATDIRFLLESSRSNTTAPTSASQGARFRTERVAWFTATALLLALVAWLGRSGPSQVQRGGAIHLSLTAPERTSFSERLTATVPTPEFALSRNGQALAFVAAETNTPPMLWVRSFDSPNARRLPATEYASGPFWSPDGRWIGYFDLRGHLKKVSIDGGRWRVRAAVARRRS